MIDHSEREPTPSRESPAHQDEGRGSLEPSGDGEPTSRRREGGPRGTSSRLGAVASESARLRRSDGRRWDEPWRPTAHVAALRDDSFAREVLESKLPVVVDFWADTCVPCRMQEPVIERLGQELAGKVQVARLNVFENPRTPEEYHIKGVPHLLVIHRGEVVLELVGDHSLEQLLGHLRGRGLI